MSFLGQVRAHGPAVARARLFLRTATDVGSRVRVYGRPIVANEGTMRIGDGCRLSSRVARLELAVDRGGVLDLGRNVFVNYGTSIGATRRIEIGDDTLIGTHCIIIDNAFHHLDPARRTERPPSEPITIGRNVWLGARVIVLPGVTIGDDACVAAGSVVTADVAPRTLVGGVPARVLREL